MTTGEVIKELRIKKGLSQEDLGKLIGVQRAAINKYEKGLVVNLKRNTIAKLASALDVTPTQLMGWEEPSPHSADFSEIELSDNIVSMSPMRKIPLVGQIACGAPILAEENIEDYIDLPTHIKADYALTCKGNSMVGAGIQDGDIVYIRKQDVIENGQIAAVMTMDSNEATLKRFYRKGNMVTLNAENPAFEPLVFINEDINSLRIVGRAVAYTHIIK